MFGRNGCAKGAASPCGRMGRLAWLQAVTRKSLVAFLTFLLAFGSTPAQLWAEGSGGIVRVVETVENDAAQTGPTAGEIQNPAEGAAEQPAGPDESAGESAAPGEGAGETGETKESESAQEPEPAASSDVEQVKSDDASAAAGADGAQAPVENPAEKPAERIATVTASAQVIGVDAEGNPEVWASAPSIELPEGSTAADLFLALKDQTGLIAGYRQEDDGYFSLDDVTSPDGSRTLAYDPDTWEFWQFFYNGTSSNTMEYQTELHDGDAVVWYYSAWGASLPDLGPTEPDQPDTPEDKAVSASIEIIGADAQGNSQRWTELSVIELPAKSTAADLSEALFKQTGIAADFGESTWGWSLNTITSPLDGRVLGWDNATQRYWQLFVNGESASLGAGSIELKAGDTVSWVYSAYGEEKPEVGDIVVNPDAERPDWGSTWPGFAQANKPTEAPTPENSGETKWTAELKDPDNGEDRSSVSDPILAGDYLYIAVGSTLHRKDRASGETLATGRLATAIDSTARMVYADGLIVVPLNGGRLQALTADTLTTVWVSEPLGEDQQALATLTVRDGCVYGGTTDGTAENGTSGYLFCVSLADGSVRWSNEVAGGGFYWAGSVSAGDYLVVGDDSGAVYSYDPATGKTAGAPCSVGAAVRSTLVSDGAYVYAVSIDGVLHKLSVAADGSVTQVASVKFARKSTSTPAVANGRIIVGGQSEKFDQAGKWSKYYYGVLAVIDAQSMGVVSTVDTVDGEPMHGQYSSGEVKSAPLVSVQDGETYVYFTSNSELGGVYRYRLGDDTAELIYTPDESYQNYCMQSVVVGPDGTLYYVNDSGALFAVRDAESWLVTFDAQGGAVRKARAKVARGGKLARPLDPTREGYTFEGWYADAACTAAWDFDDPVTDDMTLYAKWTASMTPVPPADDEHQGTGSGSVGLTGGAGSVPVGKTPLGTVVAAGKKPIKAAGKDGEADVEDAADKDTGAKSSASTSRAASAQASAGAERGASGMTVVAIAAGVLGAVGLAAAAVWLRLLKRRA